MVNAWSFAHSLMNDTFDEDYPIMNDTKITPQESDEYDIPHSDAWYDYNRNDPNRKNPFPEGSYDYLKGESVTGKTPWIYESPDGCLLYTSPSPRD